MKVHWFQHVEFEGLGAMEPWLRARGHELTNTRFFADEQPGPACAEADALIVMGGPMNIYQYRDYPWLPVEKRAIAQAVASGCRVLGVCLGSQLLADVLGGKVVQNAEREIGWWPLFGAPEGASSPQALPAWAEVMHWHGDTYSLPPGAVRLATSGGCAQQAFAWGSGVVGWQFHLELRPADVRRLVAGCGEELRAPGRWVQTPEAILAGAESREAATQRLLDQALTRWLAAG